MRGRKRTGSGWEAGGRRVVSGTGVLLRAHGAVGEDADPSNLDAAEGFRTLPSASYTSTCTSSVRCVGEVAAAEAVGGGVGRRPDAVGRCGNMVARGTCAAVANLRRSPNQTGRPDPTAGCLRS